MLLSSLLCFRDLVTTKENIVLMEEDVAEMENSLRNMNQEREEIEEDAKKLLSCVEEIAGQLMERESIFSGSLPTCYRGLVDLAKSHGFFSGPARNGCYNEEGNETEVRKD